MADRFCARIGLQISFGDIRTMRGIVNEHVIPRPVFRRSRPRDILVPLIREHELRVNIDDDTTIVEQLVMHQVTDRESGGLAHACQSGPGSLDRISASGKPLISITFCGDLAPVEMVTLFFGIRNVSESKAMTASLAFPFSGFAVTRIFKVSPNHPTT